jgi:two-component system sensor kinase FixL
VRHPFDYLFPGNRRAALLLAGLLVAAMAAADWFAAPTIVIEFLYLFPILIIAGSLDRWTLAASALVCAVLGELFSPFAWNNDVEARLVTVFLAYFGAGLFVSEAVRSRKHVLARSRELVAEVERRQSAEQHLRSLVEGCPAAILTIDPAGKVLLANEAAHELLQCEPQSLLGQSIDEYLPTLASFRRADSLRKLVRTMLECTCRRCGGETFLAHIWLSSAGPPASTGLSAVVFDTSQQLRDREEGAFHMLAVTARIMTGSFYHEVRNLCSAMRVLTTSLKRRPGAVYTEEVEGLNALVNGLEKLMSAELHPEADESFDIASLRTVLNHLRIVIGPWFEESEIQVAWHEAGDLPLVRADQPALLQVFLNLARNARRALEVAGRKQFALSATVKDGRVLVRFRNDGTPVADPATLFQPFQRGAAGSGIGLHVSQAIVRSFGGDLRYEPMPDGSCFTVVLEPRPLSEVFGDASR